MEAGRVRTRSIGDARPSARLAALAVSAGLLLLAAGASGADAQTIVNSGSVNGQSDWLTSFSTTGHDGGHPQARHIRLSLLVEHPRGRIVTGLKIDQDWDESEESATSPTVTAGLDIQQPNVAGGFNYTRVNYDFLTTTDAIAEGATYNAGTLHVRAALDNGSVSAPVSSALNFLAAADVPDSQQVPVLLRWSSEVFVEVPGGPGHFTPSFFGNATPGSAARFGAGGHDPDPRYCAWISIPPVCDAQALAGTDWRTRNQLTGATPTGGHSCTDRRPQNDVEGRGVGAPRVELPARGTFVVEGRLTNSDIPIPYVDGVECRLLGDAASLWWPLGSIDVNSSSIPPPRIATSPRPVVGGDVTVLSTVPRDPDKADGGLVQYMEWDLDGNPSNGTNGFDRATLGTYNQGLGEGTLQSETIDTDGMTPGLKTVRVRVTDNGAMSGADDVRATSEVATAQYLVDSPPEISPASVHAAVGSPVSVPLSASDADGDPITWSISDGPDHGSGSLSATSGTSNTYSFTPDAGYAGTDSVTLKVADGWGGTGTRTVQLRYDPETTIDSASPEALTQETAASFEFSSDAASALFQCRLTRPGGQEYLPFCTSPVGWSSLPDGEYRFQVNAASSDRTAADMTPAVHEWTIDTTAPATAITGKPRPRIVKRSRRVKVRFAFGAEPGASFECKLDQKSFADCVSPVTYSVKPGRHGFSVRATDEAGNLGPAEQASFMFKRKR